MYRRIYNDLLHCDDVNKPCELSESALLHLLSSAAVQNISIITDNWLQLILCKINNTASLHEIQLTQMQITADKTLLSYSEFQNIFYLKLKQNKKTISKFDTSKFHIHHAYQRKKKTE